MQIVWRVESPRASYEAAQPIAWCTTDGRARLFAVTFWRTEHKMESVSICGRMMDTHVSRTRPEPLFSFYGDKDDAVEHGWLDRDGDLVLDWVRCPQPDGVR